MSPAARPASADAAEDGPSVPTRRDFLCAAAAVAAPLLVPAPLPSRGDSDAEAVVTDAHADRAAAPDTEANRRTVRAAFEAWQSGVRPITELFAPEMVWRIEGRSAASREYRTRQQFVDEVLAPFGARFAAATPFRPVRVRALYADGDAVVVLWDGRGVAHDGGAYENSYAWFMTLRGGKVVDGTAFYDSIAFNDLWSCVRPRP